MLRLVHLLALVALVLPFAAGQQFNPFGNMFHQQQHFQQQQQQQQNGPPASQKGWQAMRDGEVPFLAFPPSHPSFDSQVANLFDSLSTS